MNTKADYIRDSLIESPITKPMAIADIMDHLNLHGIIPQGILASFLANDAKSKNPLVRRHGRGKYVTNVATRKKMIIERLTIDGPASVMELSDAIGGFNPNVIRFAVNDLVKTGEITMEWHEGERKFDVPRVVQSSVEPEPTPEPVTEPVNSVTFTVVEFGEWGQILRSEDGTLYVAKPVDGLL